MARKALASFSTYLRGNLNSLKRQGMIAFSEERKHIEAYLTLEQLRFGELLCVEYDIQAEEFLLPVLSVQPLVENAVKHGLGDSEDGGKVIIATREEKDRYIDIDLQHKLREEYIEICNVNNGVLISTEMPIEESYQIVKDEVRKVLKDEHRRKNQRNFV